MKKILVLFFFLCACGYQPLYDTNSTKIEFSKINLSGNSKINRQIVTSLNIKETNDNINKELSLDSSKSVVITSRNAQGQPSTYKTSLNVTILIKDQGKLVKKKTFSENFNYNNIENKYDLSVYQQDIQNNLVKKIIDDLILYLKL